MTTHAFPYTRPAVPPSTHQLVLAARCVMRRTEVAPENLQRAFHVSHATAMALLNQLAAWRIVTEANGAARRLVLIRPEHEQQVTSWLCVHDGVPPDPNPLEELITPALSDQLRRVLQLIAEGRDFDEIGRQLHISRNTVKTHVKRLYVAIGAERSLANLVHVAHLKGVLPTPIFLESRKDSA